MGVERVLYGKRRKVPCASGRGTMSDVTRWRIIRDGAEALIETLPSGERRLVSALQDVWGFADSMLDARTGEDKSCPNLF